MSGGCPLISVRLSWLMAAKKVVLVDGDEPIPNISFLI